MKTYMGVGLEAQSLVNSVMEGGEWSVRRSSRFIPKKDPLIRTE